MIDNQLLKQIQIVGVDFGTTNTTASLIDDNGFPQLIPDLRYGESPIPTIVGYDNGKFYFGKEAANLIRAKKPVWTQLKMELGNKNKTYTVKKFNNSDETFEITSQELITKFLEFLRENILKYLNGNQFGVVISSPAYFNQDQKAMLQNCFTLAGYDIISLISEPTAACISYAQDNLISEEDVIVFDMGGGTTDVACVKIHDGKYSALPTCGNSNLGGSNFDQKLVDKLMDHLTTITGGKGEWNKPSMKNYIHEVVENAKKDLSKHLKTTIILSGIIKSPLGKFKDFNYTISRTEFAHLTGDLIDKAMFPITECINYNDIDPYKIKKVLMVGGASLTWGIRDRIKQIFPNATIVLDSNCKNCVSKGNGIFGSHQKEFQKSIVIEKINKSIGILTIDENNPNEPMQKRHVIKIINRGDDIPAFGSYTFRTSVNNQKDAEIILMQGEGHTMENCSYIGTVVLDNIGVARAGINKITVELKVDQLGLLTVEAYDSLTYRKEKKEIKLNHNWTTLDFIKLQTAKKEEPAYQAKEIHDKNYTKFVKFYNTEYVKMQKLKPSMSKKLMRTKLKNIKEEINASNWEEVDKLVKEYHHLVSDLRWNN